MPWSEIETVKTENRHELVLTGAEVSEKINTIGGLDPTLFDLININYLDIHETSLQELPDTVSKLKNLQSLVLHSNKLTTITDNIGELSKLKLLDLSSNCLKQVPNTISKLQCLYSLNVSNNQLTTFPSLSNTKLTVLDLSYNKLSVFPDICHTEIANLSEIKLNGNSITEIPTSVSNLASLKVLLLASNQIQMLPAELADCNKLKEVDLKSNPISDRRLLKLIDQCRTKQVLDYIRQNTKNKKSKKNTGTDYKETKSEDDVQNTCKHTIKIERCGTHKIIYIEGVKSVRPYIVACLVNGLIFTEDLFKKFIKLQTKLHDTICDKRNAATIATHDFNKLPPGDLTYTAVAPKELKIKPLNRAELVSGAELYAKLKAEADEFRKEKKRNVYSGIHKYLYLLEGRDKYPCLLNATGDVISFPPVTNAEITKISAETKTLLVEVTSSVSQYVCRQVMDKFLVDTVELFQVEQLTVQQIKVTDSDGNLKTIYPARTDLVFEATVDINVIRD